MTWLEASPWPVAKLQHLFEVRGGTTPTSEPENWDGAVRWATPVDLRPVHGGYIAETGRTLTASGAASKGLTPSPSGSIILSCRAPIGYVAVSQTPMATNQGCKSLVPLQRLDSRFFRYQLEAAGPVLEAKGRGSTFVEISGQAVAEFPVAVPSLEVQRQVADLLDADTARIDTLIAKNHVVRKLLRTRWQSLLERRIFIDQNVSVCPLWLTCEITPGYAYSSDDFLYGDGPVRLLRGVNVGIGTLNWEDTVYAADDVVDTAPQYGLRAGDIVLGMDRPWISSGLRVARIGAQDLPAALVQRVARLRPRGGLDGDYLYLALQSRRFFAAFEPVMTGVSVPHVSGGQIGDFALPLPDAAAQRAVVDRLTQESARIRELAARVEQQVKLLRQRRRALITAAVTGQITV